jgi:hypothetical protein
MAWMVAKAEVVADWLVMQHARKHMKQSIVWSPARILRGDQMAMEFCSIFSSVIPRNFKLLLPFPFLTQAIGEYADYVDTYNPFRRVTYI